ncbi:unnamed protein product [Victoria cruziana]
MWSLANNQRYSSPSAFQALTPCRTYEKVPLLSFTPMRQKWEGWKPAGGRSGKLENCGNHSGTSTTRPPFKGLEPSSPEPPWSRATQSLRPLLPRQWLLSSSLIMESIFGMEALSRRRY